MGLGINRTRNPQHERCLATRDPPPAHPPLDPSGLLRAVPRRPALNPRFDLHEAQLWVLGQRWSLGIAAFQRGEIDAAGVTLAILLRGVLPRCCSSAVSSPWPGATAACTAAGCARISAWSRGSTSCCQRQRQAQPLGPQCPAWCSAAQGLVAGVCADGSGLRLPLGHHLAHLPAAAARDLGWAGHGHAHGQPGALHRHRHVGLLGRADARPASLLPLAARWASSNRSPGWPTPRRW